MVRVGGLGGLLLLTEFYFIDELPWSGSFLSAGFLFLPGVPGSNFCCRFSGAFCVSACML